MPATLSQNRHFPHFLVNHFFSGNPTKYVLPMKTPPSKLLYFWKISEIFNTGLVAQMTQNAEFSFLSSNQIKMQDWVFRLVRERQRFQKLSFFSFENWTQIMCSQDHPLFQGYYMVALSEKSRWRRSFLIPMIKK